jgi:hypothetical protein
MNQNGMKNMNRNNGESPRLCYIAQLKQALSGMQQ